ncbi:MAG: hypothetical protein EOP54_07015 [Sphingobacteriales bacterium]|nr:MAG: hypothetical protein EOP54_07015 [Sphingobacteriales bacterium]
MTKAVAGILGLAGALMAFSACEKKEDSYPDIPEITYKGINKAHIQVGTDSAADQGDWYLYYDLVDGNGDLGTKFEDAEMRVFLIDTTTGTEYKFPFPYIPKQDRSGKKYLKAYGNIRLSIPEFFRLGTGVASDTAVFSLYILDESGNKSNVIYSEPVIYYR